MNHAETQNFLVFVKLSIFLFQVFLCACQAGILGEKQELKMNNRNSLVDRISGLPDPIIHYIFSFLGIKQVIRTSILSKRWRFLWMSTPYLNFNLTSNEPDFLTSLDNEDDLHILSPPDKLKRKHFMNFVDRVLIFRHSSSAIHKFDISSELPVHSGRIFTWLTGVVKRNVQDIRLHLTSADEQLELPQEMFTSEITILIVSVTLGGFGIQLPDTVCSAAKIKNLVVEYVKLPEGDSEGAVVLSCPVLEQLNMLSCEDGHLNMFTISAPRLKTLEYVNENASPCKIHICTPELTSLVLSMNFFGTSTADCSLENLYALISAELHISNEIEQEKEAYEQCLIKVLKGISNVNAIKLSSSTLKGITGSPNILKMLPNLFRNLSDIILVECYGKMISTGAVANILKSFPHIQSVVWDNTKSHPHYLTKKDNVREGLPEQCMFNCLKTFEIRNPLAVEDELKFLELLLARAKALKKLVITKTEDIKMFDEFNKRLLAFPGASSCVLIHCVAPEAPEFNQVEGYYTRSFKIR